MVSKAVDRDALKRYPSINDDVNEVKGVRSIMLFIQMPDGIINLGDLDFMRYLICEVKRREVVLLEHLILPFDDISSAYAHM
jgi:hypothetical protein